MHSLHFRPSILLVDDTDDDAFLFERALKQFEDGYRVTHVTDGMLAIARLKAAAIGASPFPDLIFLDLKMPLCSGFEVLEWIRAQNFAPALNIAVLSGSEHPADRARAAETGASGYYVKPIAAHHLSARIATWRANRPAGENVESLRTAGASNGSG